MLDEALVATQRVRGGHRRRADPVRLPVADGKGVAGVERRHGFVRRERL
jgi:hypothetical protein